MHQDRPLRQAQGRIFDKLRIRKRLKWTKDTHIRARTAQRSNIGIMGPHHSIEIGRADVNGTQAVNNAFGGLSCNRMSKRD
jgi:hypothetical protein